MNYMRIPEKKSKKKNKTLDVLDILFERIIFNCHNFNKYILKTGK